MHQRSSFIKRVPEVRNQHHTHLFYLLILYGHRILKTLKTENT